MPGPLQFLKWTCLLKFSSQTSTESIVMCTHQYGRMRLMIIGCLFPLVLEQTCSVMTNPKHLRIFSPRSLPCQQPCQAAVWGHRDADSRPAQRELKIVPNLVLGIWGGGCFARRSQQTQGCWRHTLERKGVLLGDREPGSFSSNCLTDFCLLISVLPSVVAAAEVGSGEPCSGVLRTSPSWTRLIPRSVEPCWIGEPGILESASFEKSKPSGIQHIKFQYFCAALLLSEHSGPGR